MAVRHVKRDRRKVLIWGDELRQPDGPRRLVVNWTDGRSRDHLSRVIWALGIPDPLDEDLGDDMLETRREN